MKITVITMKTDKKGIAAWDVFQEEVKETAQQYRVVNAKPAKPEGKMFYRKSDEYVLKRTAANEPTIAYGRDTGQLVQLCFGAIVKLSAPQDAAGYAEGVEKAKQIVLKDIVMSLLTEDYQMAPEKVTKELVAQCMQEISNGPDIIDLEYPRHVVGHILSKRGDGFPETGSVVVYTDGACLGNPGPGGWAAILKCGSFVEELHGGDPGTTNNRMEMQAVISALKFIPGDRREVTIIADSKYVIDGMTKGWAKGWRANGWRKADGNPAKNADLWEQMLKLAVRHNVTFRWVKGHSGNPMNERCDMLATTEAENLLF